MIQIGRFTLNSRAVLAPMAGVTDLPFRRLCRRYGAALTPSEMVAGKPELHDSRKSQQRMLRDHDARHPHVIQIAGSEPAAMAAAAQLNVEAGADIIDINMGCPAKKVCRKAAGSALLREPETVRAILEAVVAAVDVPVSLKIRTGWSPEQRNGLNIARMAEDLGIASLAVHGRTRACRFNGQAEYDTIAGIADALTIPVFANGDITSAEKAAQVLKYTGADGVMIGRGAQGRPWIFAEINDYLNGTNRFQSPEGDALTAAMLEHLQALHDFYGTIAGPRIARKHLSWYLPEEQHRPFRQAFNRLNEPEQQLIALNKYMNDPQSVSADAAIAA